MQNFLCQSHESRVQRLTYRREILCQSQEARVQRLTYCGEIDMRTKLYVIVDTKPYLLDDMDILQVHKSQMLSH